MPTNGCWLSSYSKPTTSTLPLPELDARYAVGEAAPHATTWSLIAEAYATLNAGESPPFAADYAIVDHRLQATIQATEFDKYMHASRNLTPDLYMYVESVTG